MNTADRVKFLRIALIVFGLLVVAVVLAFLIPRRTAEIR